MPIANCIIRRDVLANSELSDGLIEAWAVEAGVSSEHMTINIIEGYQQLGNPYTVTATLILSDLWQDPKVQGLQLGLAKALVSALSLEMDEILVSVHIVASGQVTEAGQILNW